MYRKTSLLSLIILAVVSQACGSESNSWLTNIEEARELAKQNETFVLVNFTGSDWCGWCKKLSAEVFETDEFLSTAPKHFVLVKLDFPQEIELGQEEKLYNEEQLSRYGVDGFPTIMLLDQNGKAYARTGYQAGGARAYLDHLVGLGKQKTDRDELLKAVVREDQPEKKLDALIKAIETLSGWGVLASFPELKSEAIRLDENDARGLRSKYGAEGEIGEIVRQYFPLRDFQTAFEKIEALSAKYPGGEAAQLVHYYLAVCSVQLGRDDKARIYLRQAINAAPESENAPTLRRSLDSLDAEP